MIGLAAKLSKIMTAVLSWTYWHFAAPRSEPLLEIRYIGDVFTSETIDAVRRLLREGYLPQNG